MQITNSILLLSILSTHFCLPESRARTIYDLKDLQVLEQERNFEEFLLHVNDIRPSERKKLWKDMYQSMAMEMIDYKLKTKDFSLATFKRIEDIGKSSALGEDEFFQLKRSLYAKKYFNECYLQASLKSPKPNDAKTLAFRQCDKDLSSFWFFSKKDPDIGLDLASLVEKYPSELSTWPFYQRAVNDSIANLYCQKPNVVSAVIKKLTQESFEAEFNGQYSSLIKRFIPVRCFDKIVPSLKLALTSPVSSAVEKELALNLLSASGQLKPDEEDLFATIYLIDGPVVGEKMNEAWKRIERLSGQYNKRLALLEAIKKLSSIPDRVFRDPSSSRNKAIIHLFSQHFPEYLDFYAESCLAYTNFQTPAGQFASGIECNKFLKLAQELKNSKEAEWISDKISIKYSGNKKK